MAEKKPVKAAPKVAAKSSKPASYRVAHAYQIVDGKIVGRNPYSPKLGQGFFMAVHKDRVSCGQTGYMEKKSN